jgi:hypothetical protein
MQVDEIPVGRAGKKIEVDISENAEIMELKICAGKRGREPELIGKS